MAKLQFGANVPMYSICTVYSNGSELQRQSSNALWTGEHGVSISSILCLFSAKTLDSHRREKSRRFRTLIHIHPFLQPLYRYIVHHPTRTTTTRTCFATYTPLSHPDPQSLRCLPCSLLARYTLMIRML